MDAVPQSPLAHAYLCFLQLARAVDALPEAIHMDANEQALLEDVVLRWHEGCPMTVREAISLTTQGSPATLHKRVTRLRHKALLSTTNESGDRRTKYLVPTENALAYFRQLGQLVLQVRQKADSA